MTQIKIRQPETPPLTYRVDPLSALVGYATIYSEGSDRRPAVPGPRDRSRAAFVPSCPFQWLATTPTVMPQAAEPADTMVDDNAVPAVEEQSRSWPVRLWSRYVTWRERQRAAAAWEMADARTLRDIGALPDELNHHARSAAYWGW